MNNKIFDEIEDLVLYYATDDYDYKKSVALFNVGKIEKMVDYCRYLQHQLEEKNKENQQLKKQKDDVVEYIKENKDKTIMPYGDDEDTDYEVCLFEEDINNLLRMLGEIE